MARQTPLPAPHHHMGQADVTPWPEYRPARPRNRSRRSLTSLQLFAAAAAGPGPVCPLKTANHGSVSGWWFLSGSAVMILPGQYAETRSAPAHQRQNRSAWQASSACQETRINPDARPAGPGATLQAGPEKYRDRLWSPTAGKKCWQRYLLPARPIAKAPAAGPELLHHHQRSVRLTVWSDLSAPVLSQQVSTDVHVPPADPARPACGRFPFRSPATQAGPCGQHLCRHETECCARSRFHQYQNYSESGLPRQRFGWRPPPGCSA